MGGWFRRLRGAVLAERAGDTTSEKATNAASIIQDNRSAEGIRSAFLRHMRRKIFQFDPLGRGHGPRRISIPPLPPRDEFAKRICRNRDTFPRRGGKYDGRLRTRVGAYQLRQKPRCRCRTCALSKKLSSRCRAHARQCNRAISLAGRNVG